MNRIHLVIDLTMKNLQQRQSKRFNKTPEPISTEMHERKKTIRHSLFPRFSALRIWTITKRNIDSMRPWNEYALQQSCVNQWQTKQKRRKPKKISKIHKLKTSGAGKKQPKILKKHRNHKTSKEIRYFSLGIKLRRTRRTIGINCCSWE